MTFDSHVPDGTLEEKWDNHKFEVKLVNPANRRRFDIIICLLYTSDAADE